MESTIFQMPTLDQVKSQFRRGVSKTPGVCGGSACIDRTRIPVWLLEESRRIGITEARLLESYPTLEAADLVSAWAYVAANLPEIEMEIERNTLED